MTAPTMSQPVPGAEGFVYVAWHQGGAATLRMGKRHVATVDAIERRAPRETLCGRHWRLSAEVIPNDYWTDGDCARCAKRLAKETGGT